MDLDRDDDDPGYWAERDIITEKECPDCGSKLLICVDCSYVCSSLKCTYYLK